MSYNESQVAPLQFDEVADCLVALGGGNHPSELHGLLCGLFAGGSRPGAEAWIRQVSGLVGDEPLDSLAEELMSRMYQLSLNQLVSADFSITLLLPDDDEGLAQRAEALGAWCQGFLSGFGESAAGKKLSEETEGVIGDFSEIAQIQEVDDDSDESERFFIEVSEFVRMALLTVFAELNQTDEMADKKGSTVH